MRLIEEEKKVEEAKTKEMKSFQNRLMACLGGYAVLWIIGAKLLSMWLGPWFEQHTITTFVVGVLTGLPILFFAFLWLFSSPYNLWTCKYCGSACVASQIRCSYCGAPVNFPATDTSEMWMKEHGFSHLIEEPQ